jgi:hypothetical protein
VPCQFLGNSSSNSGGPHEGTSRRLGRCRSDRVAGRSADRGASGRWRRGRSRHHRRSRRRCDHRFGRAAARRLRPGAGLRRAAAPAADLLLGARRRGVGPLPRCLGAAAGAGVQLAQISGGRCPGSAVAPCRAKSPISALKLLPAKGALDSQCNLIDCTVA